MAAGKPSILIPYPGSAYEHQDINAKIMEDAGAAVRISNSKLTGELLLDKIRTLMNDRKRLKSMSDSAFGLAKTDAAQVIAADLERIAEDKP
jgi:UDP-N-acetylglucosamine--N-acetylmuramyl-(pentapeptide) pyrophosphoryl-undecaprenol N-acetylglucosamine transferase